MATTPASIPTKSQKLVLVLAISALITEADKKANPKVQEEFELQWVLYIYYCV